MVKGKNHLSFAQSRYSANFCKDFVLHGGGWFEAPAQGSILLDVAAELSGELRGVCQARFPVNPDGLLKLMLSVKFQGGQIIANLTANDQSGVCSGTISGDSLIYTVQLLGNSGQLEYEYKVKTTRVGSAEHPLGIQKARSLEPLRGVIRLWAPSIHRRDAIGNYCYWLHHFLSDNGYAVYLYADGYDINDGLEVRKCADLFYDLDAKDLLLVVYSTYDPWLSRLVALPNRKVLSFQNVTPPEYFAGWDARAERLCANAVEQFAELERFDLFFSSTAFTAEYLNSYFCVRKEFVLLPPFGLDAPLQRPDMSSWSPTRLNLLFVGRMVPNKGIDSILHVFAEVLKLAPHARLFLVGSMPIPSYRDYLLAEVHRLNCSEGTVNFLGSVTNEDLVRQYSTSDAFICMSRHEGFCVPVFEAMSKNVAVFATDQAAVAEVLNGTGRMFSGKAEGLYQTIAKEIVDVCMDRERYQVLVNGQYERAQELAGRADGTALIDQLSHLGK